MSGLLEYRATPLLGEGQIERGLLAGRNARRRPTMQYPDMGPVDTLRYLAEQAYTPAAYMTPGVGDYMAHQDAVEKYGWAKDAWQQGNYGQAAMHGAGGLVDDLTTVPVVGDLAMLAKGASLPLGALMTAYHGTPHRILPEHAPKFDLEKIGTGEGAQAYGHGIYLAENPGVAHSYQAAGESGFAINGKPLSQRKRYMSLDAPMRSEIDEVFRTMHSHHGGDIGKIKEDLFWYAARERYDGPFSKAYRMVRDAKSFGETPGNLYEVDLPDSVIDRMLDWDAPLSEQPESVRKVIENNLDDLGLKVKKEGGMYAVQDETGTYISEWAEAVNEALDSITGQNIYRAISRRKVSNRTKREHVQRRIQARGGAVEAASQDLNSLGIPGIRYYDGGSRANNITDKRLLSLYEKHKDPEKAVDEFMRYVHNTPKEKAKMRESFLKQLGDKPTRNFVIFNPDDVTILGRK